MKALPGSSISCVDLVGRSERFDDQIDRTIVKVQTASPSGRNLIWALCLILRTSNLSSEISIAPAATDSLGGPNMPAFVPLDMIESSGRTWSMYPPKSA